jgi:hypothetical protein
VSPPSACPDRSSVFRAHRRADLLDGLTSVSHPTAVLSAVLKVVSTHSLPDELYLTSLHTNKATMARLAQVPPPPRAGVLQRQHGAHAAPHARHWRARSTASPH